MFLGIFGRGVEIGRGWAPRSEIVWLHRGGIIVSTWHGLRRSTGSATQAGLNVLRRHSAQVIRDLFGKPRPSPRRLSREASARLDIAEVSSSASSHNLNAIPTVKLLGLCSAAAPFSGQPDLLDFPAATTGLFHPAASQSAIRDRQQPHGRPFCCCLAKYASSERLLYASAWTGVVIHRLHHRPIERDPMIIDTRVIDLACRACWARWTQLATDT